jgi:hypothetical protein
MADDLDQMMGNHISFFWLSSCFWVDEWHRLTRKLQQAEKQRYF